MSAQPLQPTPVGLPTVTAPSPRARLVGRVLTGIAVLFMAFDAGVKLLGAKQAVDGTVQLGYKPHHVLIIGVIALVCLIAYIIPRVAPLGAILLTGYLGGAIASQLRLDNPFLTNILPAFIVAAVIWGGLYLRDPRVRRLLSPTR